MDYHYHHVPYSNGHLWVSPIDKPLRPTWARATARPIGAWSWHWCLRPRSSARASSVLCAARWIAVRASYGKEPGWFNPCMDDLIHLRMIYLFNMVMMVMFHLDLDSWSLALVKWSKQIRRLVDHWRNRAVLVVQLSTPMSWWCLVLSNNLPIQRVSINIYIYIYIED